MTSVGTRIRALRQHQHLTLEQLHGKAQVSISAISMLEHDKYNMSLKALRRILKALKVKEGEFPI